MTRVALLFSDGSITVFAEEWPMDKIEKERADADRGAPREGWTKIARCDIEVVEVIFDPTLDVPVTTSELDRLRAENERLRGILLALKPAC